MRLNSKFDDSLKSIALTTVYRAQGLRRTVGWCIGFQVALVVKNPPAKCKRYKRPGFDPLVGEILWRRERLPAPVFWPGEFHGLYSSWGCKELEMTE